ncbi:MAG: biotin/lipoyl-binding protein [Planctomycetes bacterium]|nr:biotin/lipoyl-binding protein [Planctomycetota bacterium]
MEEPTERRHQVSIQSRPGKVPIPVRERWRDFRIHGLPLVVWLVAVAAVYTLWTRQVPVPKLTGLARTQEFEVSTAISGRLDQVLVEQYQLVQAGQLLASLDMAPHQAALETSKAELAKLSADVDSELARLQAAAERDIWQLTQGRDETLASAKADLLAERSAQMRRFEGDEADLQIEILKVELKVAEDRLEADRVEVRLERAKKLVAGSAGPEADVEDLKLRHEQALGRMKNNQVVVNGLQRELAAAKGRRLVYMDEAVDLELPEILPASLDLVPQLAGLQAAIVVQRRRLQELELVQEQYLLRAPYAGRVSTLPAPQGQALMAGEPVAILVDPKPREIMVYLPDTSPGTVDVGDSFEVSRVINGLPGANEVFKVQAAVQIQVPNVQQIPARLWKNPQMPEYGKAYVVGPVTELNLVPGERVYLEPLN